MLPVKNMNTKKQINEIQISTSIDTIREKRNRRWQAGR
jgi:hypothetical protein